MFFCLLAVQGPYYEVRNFFYLGVSRGDLSAFGGYGVGVALVSFLLIVFTAWGVGWYLVGAVCWRGARL